MEYIFACLIRSFTFLTYFKPSSLLVEKKSILISMHVDPTLTYENISTLTVVKYRFRPSIILTNKYIELAFLHAYLFQIISLGEYYKYMDWLLNEGE